MSGIFGANISHCLQLNIRIVVIFTKCMAKCSNLLYLLSNPNDHYTGMPEQGTTKPEVQHKVDAVEAAKETERQMQD